MIAMAGARVLACLLLACFCVHVGSCCTVHLLVMVVGVIDWTNLPFPLSSNFERDARQRQSSLRSAQNGKRIDKYPIWTQDRKIGHNRTQADGMSADVRVMCWEHVRACWRQKSTSLSSSSHRAEEQKDPLDLLGRRR